MSDNKDIELLLKNIQQGLKNYSVKELNDAILESLNKKHDKKDEIEYVLELVTKSYNISLRTLKQSNARGTIQDAKQVTYCLLYFNLGLPIRYISQRIFFNWPTSVFSGIKRYKTANENVKTDKIFIDKYTELQGKLHEYITKKNNQ